MGTTNVDTLEFKSLGPNAQAGAGVEMLGRVKRTIAKALDNNAWSLPAFVPAGVTIAQSATSDTTLTQNIPFVVSNVLQPAAVNQIAWHGGQPYTTGGSFVVQASSTYLPGNGNLNAAGTGSGATFTIDLAGWYMAYEFETDSAAFEVAMYLNNAVKFFVQINGRYIDKTGYTGAAAGRATSYVKVTGLTGTNRIRIIYGANLAGSSTFAVGLRLNALASLRKPDQSGALRAAYSFDSYGEGISGDNAYLTPNLPMLPVSAEMMGIRDPRFVGAGGTGYFADNSGGRSRCRDQIPRWIAGNQAPWDLIVQGMGFNDIVQIGNDPAGGQAEVAYCLGLMRASSPAPIVVLGSWAAARGPNGGTIVVENAIKAAVASMNDPLIKFAPVSTDTPTWQNGTGYVGATNGSGNSDIYVSSDATHPSAAGHPFMGGCLARAIGTAVQSMGS